jgi:hypothetical protein
MPKNVALPIPIDRWFKDVKKIEELRTVLDSEAFQTAVAILKDTAGPSYGSIGDAEANSHRHAWFAGYRDAFSDLHKLTKLQGNKPNVLPEEWTHIQTPQL